MAKEKRPAPEQSRLALRVGITGARRLNPANIGPIEMQLTHLLDAIQQKMLVEESLTLGDYYQHEPDRAFEPLLRMVSPLARGADRLAARAALNAGYKLFVPLPFPQDFTGTDDRHPEEPAARTKVHAA